MREDLVWSVDVIRLVVVVVYFGLLALDSARPGENTYLSSLFERVAA
jgi:hypothetical protein